MKKLKAGCRKMKAEKSDLGGKNGLMEERQYGYGRYAAERLIRMHREIEERRYPNASKWAREFEVSVRTVKRDVYYMKTNLNLPLEFDVARNGFYFTKPVPHFPQMPMSEADTFALFIASKAIEQYRGMPLQRMLEATFRKLTGQLDQMASFSLAGLDGLLSFRPFAPGDAELKTFELLTRAVSERRAVKFMYRNRGQVKAQQRRVHPYHIACVENQWCMFGFDGKRGDIRTFVLARLSKPVFTGKRFDVSGKFDLNEFLKGSLGLYKGREDFEVVVDLDAWAADDVRGRHLHSSQELMELPKGGLRVRMRLSSLEEVERWVLSMGTHAKVVEPKELRERVNKVAKDLVERCWA